MFYISGESIFKMLGDVRKHCLIKLSDIVNIMVFSCPLSYLKTILHHLRVNKYINILCKHLSKHLKCSSYVVLLI